MLSKVAAEAKKHKNKGKLGKQKSKLSDAATNISLFRKNLSPQISTGIHFSAAQRLCTWKSNGRSNEIQHHVWMYFSNNHALATRPQFGVELACNVGFILITCVSQHFCA